MSFVHYAVALSLLNFKVEWQLPVAVGVLVLLSQKYFSFNLLSLFLRG